MAIFPLRTEAPFNTHSLNKYLLKAGCPGSRDKGLTLGRQTDDNVNAC